jgi:phage-related tail fiber protein
LKDIVAALQKTHSKLLSAHPSLEGIISRNEALFREATADFNPPIRVAVSGASGNIGYALV